MEDQFGGRTDDDLFADDFEPVAQSIEEPVLAPVQDVAPAQDVKPDEKTPADAPSSQPKAQESGTATTTVSGPPRSLAQSRHNKPPQPRAPRPAANRPPDAQTTPAATPPAAPAGPKQAPPPGHKASPGVARLQSGANPRTKLTDEELSAKMEAMRIASAEKARRFEQAQRDERDHDLAYARGMEEARKRKAAEEERKRRGDEDRRRMEDERAKNRERKLKAMGMKEGGWDEGKHEREDEDRRRGAFRGAYGGVRGERYSQRNHGFAMERFLAEPESATHLATSDDVDAAQEEPVKEFGPNEFRGRARGPRRGTTGRGGRGGRGGTGDRNDRNGGPRDDREKATTPKAAPPAPTGNDFPALPPGSKPSEDAAAKHGFQPLPGKKNEAAAPARVPLAPLSPLSPIQWDEDVAANDAKMAAANAGLS